MSREEQWLLCPGCGAKTRLRLLQRTVLREFPLYCPKCRRESVISAGTPEPAQSADTGTK